MNLRSLLIVFSLILGNMALLYGQCPSSFTSASDGDFATGANWMGGIAPSNPIPPGVTVTISHVMSNSGDLENNGSITIIAPGSFNNQAGAIYRGYGTFNGDFINLGTVAPGSTVVMPTLVTAAVTGITSDAAVSGGTICYDGGSAITARGVCWSTTQNPTTADPHTTDGTGSGSFTSDITGLDPATTYYVRAYATNSMGTSYGEELSFTTETASSCPSSVTFTYNGSEVTYGVVASAGRCWLDRNLGATQVATSSTDADAYGDLFQWGRFDEGHQVRTSAIHNTSLASTSAPNAGNDWDGKFIPSGSSPYDWLSPQDDNLWQGVSGVNNPCPSGYRLPTEAELNAERTSWSTNNAAGAFASPLKLPMAGYRSYSNGSLDDVGTHGYYWSSTVNGIYAWFLIFNSSDAFMSIDGRANGFSVRCLKEDGPEGSIDNLDCGSASITGTLTEGMSASGVSASVPYTGGNGGSHAGQTITSTGVTGLTAYLYPGVFASGAGSLIYTITGTPASSGMASFALNIGGQMCNLVLNVGCGTVTFMYNGNSVTYGTVGSTGNKCWLDRNLGATQVATSSTDADAYGDLFQWGRFDEGHQVRTSAIHNTGLASTSAPNAGNAWDGKFITSGSSPYDWLSPQDANLWQGVSGTNNPCPSGYRVPTEAELIAERTSWSTNNAAGAFASPLKLPLAGYRHFYDGSLYSVGTFGYYWSSTVNGIFAWGLLFGSSAAFMGNYYRAVGYSVRCLKD